MRQPRGRWRRHEPQGAGKGLSLLDLALIVAILVGSAFAALPVLEELLSSSRTRAHITSMTSAADATYDTGRMEALGQAQAYNARLGSDEGSCDNAGMSGCNGGMEDVLELAPPQGPSDTWPYERQLCQEGQTAICWIDIPAIGTQEAVFHGTEDEALAAGVGHLAWSSLPVGGRSSHCVLAAHSGMEQRSMFDDLDLLQVGDHFDLHCLGDCYRYEVYEKEVVEPAEAQDRCKISAGDDLCTLITCTPYGINSHRLLVHGRRVPYSPGDAREWPQKLVSLSSRRRMKPLLILGVGAFFIACARALAWARRRGVPVRHIAFATLGLACTIAGIALMCHQRAARVAYEELSDTAREDAQGGNATTPQTKEIDWDYLRAQNDEVVAWVDVEGIDLSLPVVAPRDGDMAYYLTHDLWRDDSLEGTPFLDHRSSADGVHRLAYGHHLTTGGQFSDLQHAWEQETFDAIGICHWHTPAKGVTCLTPLCAAKVDLWFGDIQRFEFDGASALRNWLESLVGQSTATSPKADELMRDARSAVTLVTCSSDIGGQEWRTITVFVEQGQAK